MRSVAVALVVVATTALSLGATPTRSACRRDASVGPLTLHAPRGCWRIDSGVQTTSGDVVVNGLLLRGPGVVKVDSGGVSITRPRTWVARGVRLARGAFSWTTSGAPPTAPAQGGRIGGFPLIGLVRVNFPRPGAAELTAPVRVPLLPRIRQIGGVVTITTGMRSRNGLTGARLAVQPVWLARLGLKPIGLGYRLKTGHHRWRGAASISLPTEELAVSDVHGSVGFLDGRLAEFGGRAAGSIPLGEGLVLAELGLRVRLKPNFRLAGHADVQFGVPFGSGRYSVPLTMRTAFVFRPLYFWRLTGTIQPTGRLGDFLHSIHSRLRLRGWAQLRLGHAFGVSIGTALDAKLAFAEITGSMSGFVARRALNLEGSTHVTLAGRGIHGHGIISTKGVSACGRVLWITLGAIYRWGETRPSLGCGISSLRVVAPGLPIARALAGPPVPVDVVPGLPAQAFAAQSARGTPEFVAVAPGGRRYDTSQIGGAARRRFVVRPDVIVVRTPDHTTYLIVRKPAGGQWRLTEARRSPAIRTFLTADGVSPTVVTASVSGTGPKRTVTYKVTAGPHTQVDLYESPKPNRADLQIAPAVSSFGSFDFSPAQPGPQRRYIVAQISVDGIPLETRTLAAFDAPPPPPPQAPTLSAVRFPDAVVVTWGGGGAVSWIVRTALSDGRLDEQAFTDKVTAMRVPALIQDAVFVGVTPIDAYGRAGPPSSISVLPRQNLAPALTVGTFGAGRVDSSPGGIACPFDCTEQYVPGTQVTLTATPAPGSSFVRWTGACKGGNPCVVTLARAETVMAVFGFPLQVRVDGTGTVTSSPAGLTCRSLCTAAFASGTVVHLTAGSPPTWRFFDWQGDCAGRLPDCTLTMDRPRSVVAGFAPG